MSPSKLSVACANVRRLAIELGDDLGYRYGWVTAVARKLGLPQRYLYGILIGQRASLRDSTVMKIARRTKVPVEVFYDEDPDTMKVNRAFRLKALGNGRGYRSAQN